MGAIGMVPLAFVAVAIVISNSFTVELILVAVMLVVMGASSGFGLAGLFGLLCGAELDGRFALPFAVSLGSWLSPIAAYLLTATDVILDGELIFTTWIGGAVFGAVCGWLMGRANRAFGRRSRVYGACGAILIMILGGWFMITNGGLADNIFADPGAVFLFVIGLGVFALLGGVPGALAGSHPDFR